MAEIFNCMWKDFIEVLFIYNVLFIYAVQQSVSVIPMYPYSFHILFIKVYYKILNIDQPIGIQ